MVEIGQHAAIQAVVGDEDTAVALGSGDVPVLATPRVVALVEAAAVAAISDEMDEASTSVGTEIDLRHIAPSPVGAVVVASATVVGMEGRSVRFRVEVRQDDTVVASGTHTRVVVDRRRFVDRLG